MTLVTLYTGITDELFVLTQNSNDHCMYYNSPLNWLVTITSLVENKFRVGKPKYGGGISSRDC